MESIESIAYGNKHLCSPLTATPLLDENCREDILDSLEQLQIWVGDNTDLSRLSIEELLELQTQLEQSLDL
jgi:hypothetical protein